MISLSRLAETRLHCLSRTSFGPRIILSSPLLGIQFGLVLEILFFRLVGLPDGSFSRNKSSSDRSVSRDCQIRDESASKFGQQNPAGNATKNHWAHNKS